MKVFVTGASGFIGAHVTRALIGAGHEALILASPADSLWRLQEILPSLQVVRGRLEHLSELRDRLRAWQPQSCVHLAWYAEPGLYLTSNENFASLQGSIDLLRLLADCNCGHFIGAGSCAEYRTRPELLAEIDPTEPETLYAACKLAFQFVGERFAVQNGMKFAWARMFSSYGPQEDARRLVPSAILTLHRGEVFASSPGEQLRDYLHVTDVANAFVKLVENRSSGKFNVCSAQPISVKVLLNTIGTLLGKPDLLAHGKLPYREWEPMFIAGANDKMRAKGWTPRIDLRAGLRDTIKWWKHEAGDDVRTIPHTVD